MRTARRTMVDIGPCSVLGLCPLCAYRTLDVEEASVRRSLLAHLRAEHGIEGKASRDNLALWFKRNKVPA